ncbi:hypothetical protein HDU87_005924 [Geranomyces variabilis]|uniref:TLC domain-containing protein n=1 Tax=Geranomyces variabilis TaxID=109894 RepID=A0AAD5TQ38_9FUNG|nr:hypothetical protein HDU87_005924 [Geranomyces variabilis]
MQQPSPHHSAHRSPTSAFPYFPFSFAPRAPWESVHWPSWLTEPGNKDLVVPEDLTDVIWFTIAWAVAHVLVVRLILKPLSRLLVAPPSQPSKVNQRSADAIEGCTSSTTSPPRIRQRPTKSTSPPARGTHSSGSAVSSSSKRRLSTSADHPPPPADNRYKFVLSGWKFITYGVSTAIGAYIIYAEDWLLTPRLYWTNFGSPGVMTPLMKLYYKTGFSSYLYGSISIIFFEPRQKDFAVMVSHHLVTLSLMFLSYLWPYFRIGCAILLLHDLSDPIMELAKMALYAGKTRLADALFGTFALVFIVTRNWIFPFYIIRSVFQYAYDAPHPTLAMGISVRDAAVAGLCMLELFHLFWASLILRMAKNAIVNRGVGDDARNTE